MSQFHAIRSAKAKCDLEAMLRRSKLLLHEHSAFVDRPEDGVRVRGRRRPVPMVSARPPRSGAPKMRAVR